MIKRIVEISQQPARLTVHLGQLRIEPLCLRKSDLPADASPSAASSPCIPCEDLGIVIVDHPQVSYSHPALLGLLEHGAVLVVCGRNHLPAGVLLPLSGHTEVVWRVHDQIRASLPTRKRLWQQIVKAKINAQAQNLAPQSPPFRQLKIMATQVRSGDSGHVEALAARVYWAHWLDSVTGEQRASRFGRDSKGTDLANSCLNYGYAVLRAAVGRALVSAGLFPALGIQHHNRSDAFALADDMMEPLRPLVDRRVRGLLFQNPTPDSLDRPVKQALLSVLSATVRLERATGPLMVALHRMSASLVDCLRGNRDALLIPGAAPERHES